MENIKLEEIIKNKKILLYGLGTETEKVIREWGGKYHILGLLDSFRTTGEQFGYPIMDIRDAVIQKNIVIVVVARAGSCRSIAKRIRELCTANGIELYDIRGKNLLHGSRAIYDFRGIPGYRYADIMEAIENADVVSFDLVDTLVMRTVISPEDVLDILHARLLESGIHIDCFVDRRLAAEKSLSRDKAPYLSEIYREAFGDESEIDTNSLASCEYAIDRKLFIPRKSVVALLQKAKEKGKKVYITSDMYYSRKQLLEILDLCGIYGFNEILVSCDYRTDKSHDLFACLKKAAGTDNILHIGDDLVSDVQSARKHKLKALQIYSGAALLDMAGGLGLFGHVHGISDQIRLGMFTARFFNDPFQFENDDRKLRAREAADIGYLFCAPIICDFVQWFGQKTLEKDLKNIWFCARDGYLIQKIFRRYFPNRASEYFLTSRTSAVRAGVENSDDIAYVDSMKFSGKADENLCIRFALQANEANPTDPIHEEDGLLRYADAILNAAKVKRINYMKYIETLHLEASGIALFDFVAKGTNQMYIERMISRHITGLYFLQLEPEFMKGKGLDILPFYSESERESSAIYENYYILETLLTSPEPSLDEFDEKGHPVFARETRTDENIACVMRIQKEIMHYANQYIKICPKSEMRINKKLDEAFLRLIHNVKIEARDFLALTIEDTFFNRMTDIRDLL